MNGGKLADGLEAADASDYKMYSEGTSVAEGKYVYLDTSYWDGSESKPSVVRDGGYRFDGWTETKDGTETVHKSDASSADLEMVILVNENTASASEILTAALQDNNAGTVIGTKTYGKGVTQIMHKFSDGTAVKLTVTEYFRPNGETVNGVGVTPDIEAEDEKVLEEAIKELAK